MFEFSTPTGLYPSDSSLPPALLLLGPTAAGKTALALSLADALPLDIVSVDSALVYRGMDIGTSKPSPDILARCPHRLVDICDPAESYSAARFRNDALTAMAEITAEGRIPLLVGGTMLYFRVLQQGLSPLPETDPDLRTALTEYARQRGAQTMHRWLAQVDREAAARIHPNDPQRVQRALEVYLLSGQCITDLWHAQPKSAFGYRSLKLVRAPSRRDELHRRIARRFEEMLSAGFEDEVRRLWQRTDLHPELPSMRCVGYRQMLYYLNGQCSFDEMKERAIIATRQLAKRQYTWLRAEPDCLWIQDDEPVLGRALSAVVNWL